MLLSNRYSFLTDYFTQLLSTSDKPLPQSILFYGNDFDAQYTLAKEIARYLNCKENKDDNCNCLNCKWIREDAHPAVLTISKADNKPADDDSKTVISLKQSNFIKETLTNASDYHRVFIFCDRDEENNISGLNQNNFQAETANSLLKLIEEPQPGVTFIFLTRYIDDLLSTIISRSQCFFVPAQDNVDYSYSHILSICEKYWNFERKDAFDLSQKLQDLSKDISVLQILNELQNYVLSLLKNNPKETEFLKHIEIIEQHKKQANLGIKTTNIFDSLCLNLIK